jgi:hypothetical protein
MHSFNSRSSRVAAATLVTLISSLAAVGNAAGQELAPSPYTGPLEKYNMPPAPLVLRVETGPRMISQFDSFTSFQVNVDANGMNILGDAANEPSITVDPIDLSKIAIGWRQFDSITSDFRQGGYGFSTDAGTTWTFPGVLEPGVFRSDPVLHSTETGNFFYLSLLQSFCDNVYQSLNFGQSWTRLQPDGGAKGGDKEWLTIDKTNGIGHGFQYQTWTSDFYCGGFGPAFSRSTDGGITWMTPINIPNSPKWGTLDVDTNGNLFIGAGNGGSSFWCIRSSNAQNGGVTPTFDQVTSVNLGGSMLFGSAINGGLAGQIFLAVDRSGTATNNNIYMIATVRPTGASNGSDVMFSRSTDGGQTFSAAQRINDDPVNHNKWHWFGTLAVAPNGRIDSVWLDSRNAANNTDSQLFYSFSTDGGVTWAPNIAVSNSFNPFEGYPVQNKIGDYLTIVSDATGGNVAYSATFNLNPNTSKHEEDVYYVRVQPTAGPTPTPTPIPSVKVNLSVSPTQINEGQTATYTVTATSTVSQSITVGYAMSGNATNGTDYRLSGTANQVTIPAGQSSATVTLKSKADGVTEGTETATMTLQPGSGYKVGRNNQATVSILDSP